MSWTTDADKDLKLEEQELNSMNDAVAELQMEKRKIDHHNRMVKLKLKPTIEIEQKIRRLKEAYYTKANEFCQHYAKYEERLKKQEEQMSVPTPEDLEKQGIIGLPIEELRKEAQRLKKRLALIERQIQQYDEHSKPDGTYYSNNTGDNPNGFPTTTF